MCVCVSVELCVFDIYRNGCVYTFVCVCVRVYNFVFDIYRNVCVRVCVFCVCGVYTGSSPRSNHLCPRGLRAHTGGRARPTWPGWRQRIAIENGCHPGRRQRGLGGSYVAVVAGLGTRDRMVGRRRRAGQHRNRQRSRDSRAAEEGEGSEGREKRQGGDER